ncbi:hypothetical protein MTO96_034025 [Rhipicephalus appendiculatus]
MCAFPLPLRLSTDLQHHFGVRRCNEREPSSAAIGHFALSAKRSPIGWLIKERSPLAAQQPIGFEGRRHRMRRSASIGKRRAAPPLRQQPRVQHSKSGDPVEFRWLAAMRTNPV